MTEVITYDQKEVARVVKERRRAVGWTQEALGEKAGVSYATVIRIEKGYGATMDSINAVINALGGTVNVTVEFE